MVGFEPTTTGFQGRYADRAALHSDILGREAGTRTLKSPASEAGRCTNFHKPPPHETLLTLVEPDGFEPPRFLQRGFTVPRLQPLGQSSSIWSGTRTRCGTISAFPSLSGELPRLPPNSFELCRQGSNLHGGFTACPARFTEPSLPVSPLLLRWIAFPPTHYRLRTL